MADDKPLFDFDEHRQQAIANYQKVRPLYVAFAECVKDILTSSIRNSNIKISSVESRAKDVNSFAEKASEPMESEPNQPKYGSPLRDITDLAGVRVITFFLEDIARICETIESQFIVNERSNKEEDLIREERFGYQSIHYLVSLDPDRTHLPEYAPYKELLAEVQVRTTLQHAWAEI